MTRYVGCSRVVVANLVIIEYLHPHAFVNVFIKFKDNIGSKIWKPLVGTSEDLENGSNCRIVTAEQEHRGWPDLRINNFSNNFTFNEFSHAKLNKLKCTDDVGESFEFECIFVNF